MLVSGILLFRVRHEHKHSVSHLDVDQHSRVKYFLAFVREIVRLVVRKDNNLRIARVHENYKLIWGIIFAWDWTHFSHDSEPRESLMAANKLIFFKIFAAVDGGKLKYPIIVDILFEKH